jgi:2-keto-4-pentenoate hydratase/2-oxohepta-3-ene-1,7-dioic acid hydratase in catechol pathway
VKGTKPKFYDTPRVGYRANSALIATGEDIVKPKDSGPRFEYEGELVAVIGKPARRLSPADAAECIFGWTIGNDLTERDWQRDDPTNLRGKNADTFKPMGPWIVTGLDPRDMTTTVRLNGKTVHSFPTGNMLFGAAEVISAVSRYNTLSPRDVVWLGTDEVPQSVKPGDIIEIEISGIGVLRNRVVAEA